ncbi:MAG TPA: PKD domain-containing protein [Fluviicola sp.]|nr:PKD domain-containing protein [Fluviicola sp.]
MKKILLSFSVLALALAANAQTQIGNSNFESWESSTPEINEPVNWNSFKTASGGMAWASSQQMKKSTLTRPGSSGTASVVVWSKSILGVIANGNVTLGRINMGRSTASDASNHNYSVTTDGAFSEALTDTPDSVVAWVKFKAAASQQAKASIVIHNNTNGYKDPNDVAGANTVATAIYNVNSNGNVWQRLSIPFTYVGSPSNAAFIIATFATNKTPGGGAGGDSLYVDDIELVYVPKASFTASASTACLGDAVTFTNTSTNYPTSYSWDFGDGNNSTSASPSHTYATPGTYNVTLTVTNQWGSTTSTVTTITINGADPSFSYSNSTYCIGSGNQTPTVTTPGGTFTATAGLVFSNATTGEIDMATTPAGSYTVTYSLTGTCPTSETFSITITSSPDATFSYSETSYCTYYTDPSPVFGPGASAGVFSSTAGLVINGTTGEIDLSASTPGTYTVENTIAGSGACPSDFATFDVTIDGCLGISENTTNTLTVAPNPTNGLVSVSNIEGVLTFEVTAVSGQVFMTGSVSASSNTIDLSTLTSGVYMIRLSGVDNQQIIRVVRN